MNLKEMTENKNILIEKMENIVNVAKEEKRAINEEENTKFNELETQIRNLEKEIKDKEMEREMKNTQETNGTEVKSTEELETRSFENYIRGLVERDDNNITFGNNGAVVPTTIANKIIKKVYDISPLLAKSTRYNVKGKLEVPYYSETSEAKVNMAYTTEFTELEANGGKFASIELTGYLAGALAKVSKSLINNSDFDIVSEVIDIMATSISKFVEGELINGTEDKVAGLAAGVTQTVTTTSATAITADDIIKTKRKVKQAFQKDACWIMSPETLTAVSLLKDNDGRYLLQDDLTNDFGYTLLGKPVFESDNMDNIGAGNTAIYYGDMSGLATKVTEDLEIEVLREKYATQHAVGIVAWMEFDAKVEDAQKLAKLVCKSA